MAGALTLECRHPECGARGTRETFPTDRYCSERCKTRHEGRQLLSNIVYDHKFCSTCFSTLKHVAYADVIQSRQPLVDIRNTPEAFIGYQYRDVNATTGEKLRAEAHPPLIGTGTICGVCGTTDTNGWPTDDELVDPVKAAERFITAVRYDAPDVELDAAAVIDAVERTGDLEYAVGCGVTQ